MERYVLIKGLTIFDPPILGDFILVKGNPYEGLYM
jgi:hypothetical protein